MATDTKQIKVKNETLEKLKNLKEKKKLKSIDIVIQHLISNVEEPNEEDFSIDREEEVEEMPQGGRKMNVREPLFTFEKLVDRHEMMEYYTGFDESAVRILILKLQEVTQTILIFFKKKVFL
jgi:predicted CopG family antitoxin